MNIIYMTKIDISQNVSKGNLSSEMILGILFIIYLVIGYPTPQPLAEIVHSNTGTFIVVVLFLSLFLFCSPILAILGLFVGFELIRRSEPKTTFVTPGFFSGDESYDANMITETINEYAQENNYEENNNNDEIFEENKKNSFFTASNQFPYTLEEEVVKVMAPSEQAGPRTYQDQYQPNLEYDYDADEVDYHPDGGEEDYHHDGGEEDYHHDGGELDYHNDGGELDYHHDGGEPDYHHDGGQLDES